MIIATQEFLSSWTGQAVSVEAAEAWEREQEQEREELWNTEFADDVNFDWDAEASTYFAAIDAENGYWAKLRVEFAGETDDEIPF